MLLSEEERFAETLDQGLKILDEVITIESGIFPQVEGVYNDNTGDGTGCAVFVLGHDAATNRTKPSITGYERSYGNNTLNINLFGETEQEGLDYDGWSLGTYTHNPSEDLTFKFKPQDGNDIVGANVGSIIFSSYYKINLIVNNKTIYIHLMYNI